MGDKTGIAWTDATWNPTIGCTRVSEGCRHCYAERMAARFAGPGQPYEGVASMTPSGPRWTNEVRVVMKRMNDPVRWTRPRRIFVNSMSDLFHPAIAYPVIWMILETARRAPQHTYQVLTKRPGNAAAFFEWLADQWMQGEPIFPGADPGPHSASNADRAAHFERLWSEYFPNVWLGTSTENQETAEERVPLLLRTPARIKWLSVEPMIGPVRLRPEWIARYTPPSPSSFGGRWDGPLTLHWVVIGGESGPGARPMSEQWPTSLMDQCRAAGVPVFFKQAGDKLARHWGCAARKGDDPDEWPEEFRVQEYPV